jgi:hypothetical protein
VDGANVPLVLRYPVTPTLKVTERFAHYCC